MKQPLRLFSIGLMTAGLIMLVVYMFDESEAEQKELTTEEMTETLEKQDMRVISEDEYIAMSVDKTNKNKSADKEEDKTTKENESNKPDTEKDTEDSKKDDVESDEDDKKTDDESDEQAASEEHTYTLTIKSGMSSTDISSTLEENDIIDSAEEFNAYMQENDYSMLIQLGTVEVNSSMSAYDLAESLTTP